MVGDLMHYREQKTDFNISFAASGASGAAAPRSCLGGHSRPVIRKVKGMGISIRPARDAFLSSETHQLQWEEHIRSPGTSFCCPLRRTHTKMLPRFHLHQSSTDTGKDAHIFPYTTGASETVCESVYGVILQNRVNHQSSGS